MHLNQLTFGIVPVLQKKFTRHSFIFAYFMYCIWFAHVLPVQAEGNQGQQQPGKIYNATLSAVEGRKIITGPELKQVKTHFHTFISVLEQKLLGAEDETKLHFEPIRRLINSILTTEDRTLKPGDDHYQTIAAILTKTANNPVLAMALEESLRHPDQKQMAVILPDKGPGATYSHKETVRFGITAIQDSFIQVFFLSIPRNSNKETHLQQLLFHPAPGKKTVVLNSGDTLILGEDGSFSIEPPYGTDIIIVVASQEKLPANSSTVLYPVPYPLDFEALFIDIYGKEMADTISLHSCFIESRPQEN